MRFVMSEGRTTGIAYKEPTDVDWTDMWDHVKNQGKFGS